MKFEECQVGLEVYFVNWYEYVYDSYKIKHDKIGIFDKNNVGFYSEGYDGWACPVSLEQVFLTEKEAAIYLQSLIPRVISECLGYINELNESLLDAQQIIKEASND
jgi:hypothetical protein